MFVTIIYGASQALLWHILYAVSNATLKPELATISHEMTNKKESHEDTAY